MPDKTATKGDASQDMYYTEDTFEASFFWARGLQFHHIERAETPEKRCKFFFIVPQHVDLVELKKLWANEAFSRPLKDLLLKRKQLQDELRRFYSSHP